MLGVRCDVCRSVQDAGRWALLRACRLWVDFITMCLLAGVLTRGVARKRLELNEPKSGVPFASYNGTAPIEASSGEHRRHRLNQRGNRQLNYAIHVAAISQLRYPCPGREYYDRKRAEGKSSKEAIRVLKRQISNVVYRALVADARRSQNA